MSMDKEAWADWLGCSAAQLAILLKLGADEVQEAQKIPNTALKKFKTKERNIRRDARNW